MSSSGLGSKNPRLAEAEAEAEVAPLLLLLTVAGSSSPLDRFWVWIEYVILALKTPTVLVE
jgi:hypothetical protein